MSVQLLHDGLNETRNRNGIELQPHLMDSGQPQCSFLEWSAPQAEESMSDAIIASVVKMVFVLMVMLTGMAGNQAQAQTGTKSADMNSTHTKEWALSPLSMQKQLLDAGTVVSNFVGKNVPFGSLVVSSAGLCYPNQGTPKKEINSFDDAWSHWNSLRGGVVPAGPGLYDIIRRNCAGYTSYVDTELQASVETKLRAVSKSTSSGTIYSSGVRSWDCMPLGGFVVNIQYLGNWSATSWSSNRRTVSTTVIVQIAFNDVWDFTWNDQYPLWKNIAREWIPEILAGCGEPFRITGAMELQKTLKITQSR